MRAALCLLLVAACYSPSAVPGGPCSAQGNCPSGLMCTLVDSERRCLEEAVTDARGDGNISQEAGGNSAWELVQVDGNMGNNVSFGNPSGEGHLIVVAVETNATDVMSVTDNLNHVYVAVPGTRARSTIETLGVEFWYLKESKAGITRITANASMVYGLVAWEVSGLGTIDPFHVAAKVDDQMASPVPYGAPIDTPEAGEFVVSVIIVANMVSGIRQGNEFTNDKRVFGNGWAHITSANAPAGRHQAQWDGATSGVSCSATAAFH